MDLTNKYNIWAELNQNLPEDCTDEQLEELVSAAKRVIWATPVTLAEAKLKEAIIEHEYPDVDPIILGAVQADVRALMGRLAKGATTCAETLVVAA